MYRGMKRHVWVTAGSTTSSKMSGADIGESRLTAKPLHTRILESQVDTNCVHLIGQRLRSKTCLQEIYQALN